MYCIKIICYVYCILYSYYFTMKIAVSKDSFLEHQVSSTGGYNWLGMHSFTFFVLLLVFYSYIRKQPMKKIL